MPRLDQFFVRIFDFKTDGLQWIATRDATDEDDCLTYARAAAERYAAVAAYSDRESQIGGGITRIGVFGKAAALITMGEFL